eukprot:1688656-Amphidinium_carterae.1
MIATYAVFTIFHGDHNNIDALRLRTSSSSRDVTPVRRFGSAPGSTHRPLNRCFGCSMLGIDQTSRHLLLLLPVF